MFLVDGLGGREGIESFATLMGCGFLVLATVALVMNVRAYGQAEKENDWPLAATWPVMRFALCVA